MLSGAFQNMDSWKKFSDFFSKETLVVLADLPGVGKSDPVPEDLNMEFFCDCIKNLLDHLQIKKINIIAASYGTPIAHRFAQLFPKKMAKLVLTGTMREIPKNKRNKVSKTLKTISSGNMPLFAEEISEILLRKNKAYDIKKFELANRIILSVCKSLNEDEKEKYIHNTKRLLTHQPLDLTHKSKVPALVFTGEYDPFTKPKYCEEIAKTFKKSVFVTIKNADHLYHIEQPEVASNLTFNFFKNMPIQDKSALHSIKYFS